MMAMYDERGQTLLATAVEQNSLRCAKAILELTRHSVNCEGTGWYYGERPIDVVRNTEMLQLLVAHGASVQGEESHRPIVRACKSERSREIIECLVDGGGAEIDAIENGKTALMVACENGQVDTVEFLLERGANPNFVDDCGRTAIYYSCEENYYSHGQKPIWDLLVQYGARMDIKDELGSSPLEFAAIKGHQEIVHYYNGPMDLLRAKLNKDFEVFITYFGPNHPYTLREYEIHLLTTDDLVIATHILRTLVDANGRAYAQKVLKMLDDLLFESQQQKLSTEDCAYIFNKAVNWLPEEIEICDVRHIASILDFLLTFQDMNPEALDLEVAMGKISNDTFSTVLHELCSMCLQPNQGLDILCILREFVDDRHCNARDYYDNTPMHLLPYNSHDELFLALLASGARPEAMNIFHELALPVCKTHLIRHDHWKFQTLWRKGKSNCPFRQYASTKYGRRKLHNE